MTLVEHPGFTARIQELVPDEEYQAFQTFLATHPNAGAVIPGLGGLRKIRLALPGRGKRGGARVLYLCFLRAEQIYLVYVFTKGDFADLPPDKRRAVQALVLAIRGEYGI